MAFATAAAIPDQLDVEVGLGGRVLVVSDLLLGPTATPASASATTDLARAVEAWSGPGALIVAGNLFDLLVAEPTAGTPDPGAALDAHPRLAAALRAFGAGEGRRLICLPGSRDARLAWDDVVARSVATELGAELALATEVVLETGTGSRCVRVEPGHRFDPRHALADPRNPACTPVGHHVLAEMLPALGGARSSWLQGVDRIPEPSSLPRFLASRLAYRRLARHAWWLLVPLALAVLLKVPISYLWAAPAQHLSHLGAWPRRLGLVGLTTVLDLVLVVLGVAWVSTAPGQPSEASPWAAPARTRTSAARAAARSLVGADRAGLVTGHTRQPELTLLGPGFYANAGAVTEVVDECPARLGLPPVFLHRRQLSWIELEAGAELHARLLQARLDLEGATVIERLAARRGHIGDPHPAVVATFPHGPPYPQVADPACTPAPGPAPGRRRPRARRRGQPGLGGDAAVPEPPRLRLRRAAAVGVPGRLGPGRPGRPGAPRPGAAASGGASARPGPSRWACWWAPASCTLSRAVVWRRP